MGSQHESDHPMPFGYQAIDPSNLSPFHFDPGQPGTSLLDNHEKQVLDDFFEMEVMAGQLHRGSTNTSPPWMAEGVGVGVGPGIFTNEWMLNSVPELIATGSFQPLGDDQLGHGIEQHEYYQFINPNQMTAPHNGRTTNHSPDVVAAATVLMPPFGTPGMPTTAMAATSPTTLSPAGQSQVFTFGGYGAAERNMVPRNDGLLTDMIYGPGGSARPPVRRQPPAEIVQYGTDPNFNRPRYQPPSWRESLPAIGEQQNELMQCLERTDSAAPTRVSSPVPSRMQPLEHSSASLSVMSPTRNTTMVKTKQEAASVEPIPEGEAAPRKRIKSKPDALDDAQTVHSYSPSQKGGRSEKPPPAKGPGTASPGPTSTGTKKRKRANNTGSSPPKVKENLTEEQKRENHIKSEQKRRSVIQQGYKDLEKLIPGCENAGLSKSVVLQKAGDHLQGLLARNQALREELEALKVAESGPNGADA